MSFDVEFNKLIEADEKRQKYYQDRRLAKIKDPTTLTMLRMWNENKPIADIGRAIDRSPSVVRKRLRRLGVYETRYHHKYEWTEDQEKELTRLWNDGVMIKIICHKLGKSDKSIQCKRISLGLPDRLNRRIPMKSINTYVTDKTYRRLSARAIGKGQSLSTYIRIILERVE